MDTALESKVQCEAMTLASTYTPAHRCLNRHGVQGVGGRHLCAHHRSGAGPRPFRRGD
ncbi:MAG: hypothetical protein WC881_03895 [Elusimicrobiota bacterium]